MPAPKEKVHIELENIFFNQLRKDRIHARFYTSNGICLKGRIASFNDTVIALVNQGNVQLVYKNNLTSVIPDSSIELSFLMGVREAIEAEQEERENHV